MRRNKTKTVTIEWHTGRPAHSGTYLCIAGSVDNMGRLQPYGIQSVYILHYSQKHHAWGMHDWDDPQRQTVRWDDVRAWAPLTTSLQALRGWHIEPPHRPLIERHDKDYKYIKGEYNND